MQKNKIPNSSNNSTSRHKQPAMTQKVIFDKLHVLLTSFGLFEYRVTSPTCHWWTLPVGNVSSSVSTPEGDSCFTFRSPASRSPTGRGRTWRRSRRWEGRSRWRWQQRNTAGGCWGWCTCSDLKEKKKKWEIQTWKCGIGLRELNKAI